MALCPLWKYTYTTRSKRGFQDLHFSDFKFALRHVYKYAQMAKFSLSIFIQRPRVASKQVHIHFKMNKIEESFIAPNACVCVCMCVCVCVCVCVRVCTQIPSASIYSHTHAHIFNVDRSERSDSLCSSFIDCPVSLCLSCLFRFN